MSQIQLKIGTVLIEFDPAHQAARVRARQSRVDRMQIELDSASAKFERQQELFESRVTISSGL